jgi:uncharacterized protein
MAGTFLGARIAAFMSGAAQLSLFAVVMLVAALFMFRDESRRALVAPTARSDLPPSDAPGDDASDAAGITGGAAESGGAAAAAGASQGAAARAGAAQALAAAALAPAEGAAPAPAAPPAAGALPGRRVLLTGFDGLAVGVLTGIVGVGGGFLIVPALVLLGGVPMKVAVGTSLMIIALKSATGFAGYMDQVEVPWMLMLLFSAVAVAGILTGTRIVRHVPAGALRRAFAVFLVLMGGLILYQNRIVFLELVS